MQKLHNTQDNFTMELDGAMDAAQTTMDVVTATGAPTVPFYVYVDSECLECTAVASNRFTVVRGCGNTSPSGHDDAAMAYHYNTALMHQEVKSVLEKATYLLSLMQGGGDGVMRNDALSFLKVVAQSTPDMTVQVSVGAGFVSNRHVVQLTAEDTAAISAPTTNPRIDLVQIDQYDTVSIKTGSESATPSAPSADSGAMGLATIYCRVGMTVIKDTDDTSNGYLTDVRAYV